VATLTYNNSRWDIGLQQDDRYQPGKSQQSPSIQPSASIPWLDRNEIIENNLFGDSTGGAYQFYVSDNGSGVIANALSSITVQSNLFVHKDTASEPSMVGWQQPSGSTVLYQTPAEFASGVGQPWTNFQSVSDSPIASMIAFAATTTGAAVPLPQNVATAIGQSVATQHFGSF
jgi:hypothetical protein